ncbi:MAG TPA: M23 family peptidase [Cytophagales bacterium]|nr:M23 family peptidase [Cytophagales bacterium]
MGELRATHFHAGIDVKTSGREGWPVHITAGGYVSRIKISTGGYGHALYVQHPDGNTSVYAHLQRFAPEVEQWVRQAQYEKESYVIELFPEAEQFAFKGGEVIAWSGNTGGSSGPHLHFEIRDNYQRPLNPLSFGFDEVKDQIPPTLVSLAIRPLHPDARVGGQYQRQQFDIQKVGNEYQIRKPMQVYGTVGFEVYSFDRQNGSLNRNGYPDLELYIDGVMVWRQHINRFSFGASKGIYTHYNYAVSRKIGRRYAKLYMDDGNPLDFYLPGELKGKLTFTDGQQHSLKLVARDTYGNESVLNATLQGTGASKLPSGWVPFSNDMGYTVEQNQFLYYIKDAQGCEKNTVYANRMQYALEPAYVVGGYTVFQWDLRRGLPDSARFCGVEDRFALKMQVPSSGAFTFYDKHATYDFSARSLFDTAYLESDYAYDRERDLELFTISSPTFIPLQRNFQLRMKPTKSYNQERARAYLVNGEGNYRYAGGEWENNSLTFSSGLGTYTILSDTVPPIIKPYWVNREEFRFRVEDVLSGIATYEARLNGEWVLLYYERKASVVWSKKLDESKPFQGQLVIRVTDNSGNETIYETKIQ